MVDIDNTLKERGTRYGEFKDHAFVTQGLKHYMHNHPNWNLMRTYQREALEMIQHKIARIINGDPDYLDNWVDIMGYTKLVIDILEKANVEKVPPV